MVTRISKWTTEQRELVLRRAVEMANQRGPAQGRGYHLNLLREAQLILPELLQRKSWTSSGAIALKAELRHRLTQVATIAPPEEPAAEHEEAAPAEPSEPTLTNEIDRLVDHMANLIAESLKPRLLSLVNAMLPDIAERVVNKTTENLAQCLPVKTAKPSLHEVVVFGLRPTDVVQMTKTEEQCDQLKIIYVDSPKFVSNAARPERVLVQMVRFTPHLPDSLRQGYRRTIMVTGGVSSLRHQLLAFNSSLSWAASSSNE